MRQYGKNAEGTNVIDVRIRKLDGVTSCNVRQVIPAAQSCQARAAKSRDRAARGGSQCVAVNCKGAPAGAPPEIGRYRLSFFVVNPVEPAEPITVAILPL